ncbi:MAG TPA: hypothetical protein VMZ91_14145 [Candidatus Paceibacterota bacterium]|nr:hypothetical protein [Candidatus Paceibacterota bacterium]
MVGFNIEVYEDLVDGELILNYELNIDLDNDCASFRILMSKSEFMNFKKIVNEK